jgi:hypothetical protein
MTLDSRHTDQTIYILFRVAKNTKNTDNTPMYNPSADFCVRTYGRYLVQDSAIISKGVTFRNCAPMKVTRMRK